MALRDIFRRKPLDDFRDEENALKFKKPVYVKDDLEAFNRLLKGLRAKGSKAKPRGMVAAGHAFVFPEKNQRVMFKMSYSRSLAAHEKYTEHYMTQEDKEYVVDKPVLFGIDSGEYEENKTGLHYKCIISPENQSADFEELARSFIRRVEAQTGYSLCWRGAVHTDTGHRHVHVVINGRDRKGREVYFNRETIILMRAMCMNAATTMLGERTKADMEIAREKLFSANRWTSFDERLEKYGRRLDNAFLPMDMKKRLEHLASIKLAAFDGTDCWILADDWKETLRAAGRYNTYLEERMKDGEPLELYRGGKVSGVVERTITFDADEAWNDALVIRSEGKRIYVPVWQLRKENLKGKTVTITGGIKGDGKISRQVGDSDISVRTQKR